MTSAIHHLYRPTAWEIYESLPEGVLAEVVDDVLYVWPFPTLYHQRVSTNLTVDLANYVRERELGEVLQCQTGVFLDEDKTVVGPDIIFISHDNNLIKDRKGLHGAPDLLIEVLSPSTQIYDLTIKKNLYERAGVREYWVVHPETKEAQGYLLHNGQFGEGLNLNSTIHIRILDKIFEF
jgi:Uma2 family endonuclease